MTTRLVAAIDDSPSARTVLEAARAIAPLFGASVEALHARLDGTRTVRDTAASAGVALREEIGDPRTVIEQAAENDDVVAVVVGGRLLDGGPLGHVALDVLQRAARPVVLVPPDSAVHTISRVLLPLDGTGATTHAVAQMYARATSPHRELVVLHVFEPDTLPPFGDQVAHAFQAWSSEFLARYSPAPGEDLRIETRVGDPSAVVRAVTEELRVDLVVVAWKQDFSPGHAAVIGRLLAGGHVPVLLLPLADTPADGSVDARVGPMSRG